MPLIDTEEKEQKVPELNFPVNIKTHSTIFNDAIEDIDIVAESVTFDIENKNFIITGESDLSKAHVEIVGDEETNITVESEDKIKAKYGDDFKSYVMPQGGLIYPCLEKK